MYKFFVTLACEQAGWVPEGELAKYECSLGMSRERSGDEGVHGSL